MHGGRAEAFAFVAAIELDSEQDVRGLGAAVGAERGIFRVLKVGIVEVHIGKAVAGGRKIHQPRALVKQRRNPVHQHEMPEMIGAELGFETIRRLALWHFYLDC